MEFYLVFPLIFNFLVIKWTKNDMKVTSAPDLVFFMNNHDINLFLALFGPSKSSLGRTKSDEKEHRKKYVGKPASWTPLGRTTDGRDTAAGGIRDPPIELI